MERSVFDRHWDTAFRYLAEKIEQSAPDEIFFSPSARDDIYEKYMECRYFLRKQAGFKDEELIDRHKIASLLIKAIIEVLPFGRISGRSEKGRKKILFLDKLNEVFAFNVALGLLSSYITSANVLSSDDLKKKFIETGFVFPKPESYSYQLHVYRLLSHSIKTKRLDVLAFSNILFLLEEFTFLALRLKAVQLSCVPQNTS